MIVNNKKYKFLLCLLVLSLGINSQYLLNSKRYNDFNKNYKKSSSESLKIINELENKKNISDLEKAEYYFLKAKHNLEYELNFEVYNKLLDSSRKFFESKNDASAGIVSLSFCNVESNPDKIFYYTDLAKKDLFKINDSILIFEYYGNITRGFIINGELDSALKYLKKGEKYIVTDSQFLESKIARTASVTYTLLGLYSVSIDYLEKHLRLIKFENNLCENNDYIVTLAEVYFKAENYTKSKEYTNKFKPDEECSGFLSDNYYHLKSHLFLKFEEYDSCQYYIDSILRNTQSFSQGIGEDIIDHLQLKLFFAEGKYKECIQIADKRNNFAKRNNITRGFLQAFTWKSKSFNELKNYSEALFFADSAIKYAHKAGNNKNLIELYNLKSEILINKKLYKEAIFYINIKDSLQNVLETKKNKLEANHSLMALENKLLEKDNKLKEQENSKNRELLFYKNLLLIGVFVIMFIGILFFINYWRRSKKERDSLKRQRKIDSNEIKVLNNQLSQRKEENEKIKIENIFSDESILKRLKETDDWVEFFINTERTFEFSFTSLSDKYPSLTKMDFKHISLIMFNLSNKEVADILFITENGSKKARQRIKHKMALQTGVKLQKSLFEVIKSLN